MAQIKITASAWSQWWLHQNYNCYRKKTFNLAALNVGSKIHYK